MTLTAETPSLPSEQSLSRAFYTTAWRWHFYAGLYVAPFLIMLAITGLIMLWASVLVGRDGEKLYSVTPGAQTVTVSAQADAAVAAVPGGTLVQYIVPRTEDQAALFRVNAGEASTMVAVDPFRGTVLGTWERRTALYDLANDIHGTLLIGTAGDRMIEVAAGFGIILVVTGTFLWWPRDGRGLARSLLPQFAGRSRQVWKSLHQTVGVYAALLLVLFLVSGLSWAGIWGERMTQAWSTFPAEKWDNVPLSDATHANMNHGGVKTVAWALEQTQMPASGSHAGHEGVPAGQPVDLNSIVALARSIGYDGRFQLSFPSGESGVWTLARDTMSDDSTDPTSDRTVHIDRYTGKVLADVGFGDYGAAGKAMAVGIALHEGDMGVWNIALNTLFCLSVIFLSVSGIVMWWKRRPTGARRLVAPVVPGRIGLWKSAAVLMLAVSLLFPLTGIVLVTVLLLDFLVIRHVKPIKRALS